MALAASVDMVCQGRLEVFGMRFDVRYEEAEEL
jgi:hypothetical protein